MICKAHSQCILCISTSVPRHNSWIKISWVGIDCVQFGICCVVQFDITYYKLEIVHLTLPYTQILHKRKTKSTIFVFSIVHFINANVISIRQKVFCIAQRRPEQLDFTVRFAWCEHFFLLYVDLEQRTNRIGFCVLFYVM